MEDRNKEIAKVNEQMLKEKEEKKKIEEAAITARAKKEEQTQIKVSQFHL